LYSVAVPLSISPPKGRVFIALSLWERDRVRGGFRVVLGRLDLGKIHVPIEAGDSYEFTTMDREV
jgi:hypothetical protein